MPETAEGVPPHRYREIDPARPSTMGEQLIRELVADRVEDLGKLLHYSDLVGERESWAIPIALDCGFSGTITISVDARGSCERRPSTSPATNGRH
jgi:hypothetical protein